MPKLLLGSILLLILFLFIRQIIRDKIKRHELNSINDRIDEKSTTLKNFSRQNKEVDLDEKIIEEQQKLNKRKDDVAELVGDKSDKQTSE